MSTLITGGTGLIGSALAELVDAIRTHKVAAVVHLAFVLGGEGNRVPERATRINILGTVNALEAARLSGAANLLRRDGEHKLHEGPVHVGVGEREAL